jgi:molecular chaperone GrpE
MVVRRLLSNLRGKLSGEGRMVEDFKQENSQVTSSLPVETDKDSAAVDMAVSQETGDEASALSSGSPSETQETQTLSGHESAQLPAEEEAVVAPETLVSIERFEALQKQKDELYERLLRKQAEFENFRKRTEREKQDFYEFALADFIRGLLPALDGLERGLAATEGETVESHKRGIELILKQLRDHLASVGVQPIRSMGKIFDPNFHQAVLREESAVLPDNEIIEEMQRGYMFKDRLLRPSMVKVAVPVKEPETALEAVPEAAEPVDNQEPAQ